MTELRIPEIPDDASSLTAALAYAAAGLRNASKLGMSQAISSTWMPSETGTTQTRPDRKQDNETPAFC